jgi:hypothetical protein
LHRLAECSFVRRFLEVVFAARSRWHLVRLDQSDPPRAQLRILRGLIHHARATPFGREHDFARIRSVSDFRRLVPVRTFAELWRAYGQAGHTWTASTLLAAPHPILGDSLRPVALSAELLASQRRALRTALALVLHTRPRSHLLCGPILWLGDDTLLSTREGNPACSAGLIGARFPRWLRPAVQAGLTWDCQDRQHVDSIVPGLARRLAQESPTCLVGPAERISSLLEQVSALRGGLPWPDLAAVLYTRRDPTFSVQTLRQYLAPSVVVLELLTRPQGPVAVEDPRYGGLRLLTDHGVFFELLPAADASGRDAERPGLEEAQIGVPYEIAITSPGGVWACRSGLRICFDTLDPPLFRVLPAPVPAVRSDGPVALPRPAPHRQSGGTPAELPERSVHSPWSIPVDRG